MTSIFNESEQAWLKRRAAKIAKETGEPWPIARSMAVAELTRLRQRPKADVIELRGKTPPSEQK